MKKLVFILSLITTFNYLNAAYYMKYSIPENTIIKKEESQSDIETDLGFVDSSLVVHLDAKKIDSYNENTWFDLTQNNNDAILTSSVEYKSEVGSFLFNGTDAYGYNNNALDIPIGNSSRTFMLWVNSKEEHQFFTIGNKTVASNQIYVVSNFRFNNLNYIYTDAVYSQNNLTVVDSHKPIHNQWNHITFGNDGQNWFYYLNGELKSSGVWSVQLNTVGNHYTLGKRNDSNAVFGQSELSVFKVFNRSLNTSEILEDYNRTKSYYQ